MNGEQMLVNKWRNLPPEKQQEVIDFVEFIELRILQNKPIQESQQISDTKKATSKLGQRLRAIREEVVVLKTAERMFFL